MPQKALLALANGMIFHGISVGAPGITVGEVIFNTAMTGYQEILTDPSYYKQIVTFTYPHIGNTGINAEDAESHRVWCAGAVLRESPTKPSNWRSQKSLTDYFKEQNVVAIADIDTRHLTHILRDQGAQNACMMAGDVDDVYALQQARSFPGLNGLDLAKEVTCNTIHEWSDNLWHSSKLSIKRSHHEKKHIVVYDYGVKQNILRMLVARGCKVTVVPAQTPFSMVIQLDPDGVLFSNGPGDPAACTYAIEAIRQCLVSRIPLLGICLGHQLLGLACGATTIKMKFGHHGANHPILEIASGRVFISSQNHGFAVDETSLPKDLQITHRSLFDNTLQGLAHRNKLAFGFQGHPEASPGPHDLGEIFDQFIKVIVEAGVYV